MTSQSKIKVSEPQGSQEVQTFSEIIAKMYELPKIERMVKLLVRENGATLEELSLATGWLINSVRGAMSTYVKKHEDYKLISEKVQGIRRYRLIVQQTN